MTPFLQALRHIATPNGSLQSGAIQIILSPTIRDFMEAGQQILIIIIVMNE
jgi:hypothetical protein